PVIVVPGIMGTNLRATTDPSQEQNRELKPGEAAWRPPNGVIDSMFEADVWKERKPATRQRILDPATLEVDDSGEIDLPIGAFADGLHEGPLRKQGWGEIHWDTYGHLLVTLENNLNTTFTAFNGFRTIKAHWKTVNHFDRHQWGLIGRPTELTAPIGEAEFEKFSRYYYPVHACGYNWLQSCEQAAAVLKKRIESVIKFYADRNMTCSQVILVTHSMGGLVARACAKAIPDKIAGIVHGAMPALGAPVCYRRIACGTEATSPSAGSMGEISMEKFAEIAGATTAATTPVMAVSPGVLELLPNHLYPGPWLLVTTKRSKGDDNHHLDLPVGNPYDLYRDTTSWYRMVNPALADPADIYKGGVGRAIKTAVDQAERFHTKVLDSYYHPNTYAFYSGDAGRRTYGQCRWISSTPLGGMSIDGVNNGKFESYTNSGGRNVTFKGGKAHHFMLMEQDANGDGTVPLQSGAGPEGKVRQAFRTRGYDHGGSMRSDAMLLLTQHLIVKIVQGVK
ncbi:MAG: hypothetical protein Q8R69_26575, partial [Telluria sp.]|nr:hypothetical protein [Telluria sp.]